MCRPSLVLYIKTSELQRSSRKSLARVNCIRQLRGIGSVLCVSFVAVKIQRIIARRGLDALRILNRLNPFLPPTTRLRVRPRPIWLQDSAKPQYPRCDLYVNKGNLRSQEEGSGCVGSFDQGSDVFFEFLCFRNLF